MNVVFRSLHSIAFLALLALTLSDCRRARISPFPESGEVSGWQKTEGTRTFASQDLWQYIDGDAEQYVQAGVVTTSTSDYKFKGQIEAVVDVHTMRNEGGALRIFENTRGSDAKQVTLGDAGVAYGQSVLFRKGPYLVRVIAYQSSPATPEALLSLANAVEKKL